MRGLSAGLTAAGVLVTCLAHAAVPGQVQQRFNNQQARIHNGVATGALTHHEAVRDESHLRADERLRNAQLARDHGAPLTAHQRAVDNHLLNRNSNRIYDTKHNAFVAPPGH